MQTINLDLSVRSIIPLLHAKQGDVGRKFKVVLTDNLVAYPVPLGAAVSVWYSGPSGQGNYTDIGADSAVSVSGNEITVELITQMLANAGEGRMCLAINTADGDQIGTWNIPYVVEPLPGLGSEAAKDYFTAFSQAVENLPYPDASLSVPGKAADAAAVGTALAGKAPAGYGFGGNATTDAEFVAIVDRCLAEMPGDSIQHVSIMQGGRHSVTIRKHLDGYADIEDISYALAVGFGAYYFKRVRSLYGGNWNSWEWENPPMQPGTEYRTTERWNGMPLYKKFVNFGALPNNTFKAHAVSTENVTIVKVNAMSYNDSGTLYVTLPYEAEGIHFWCYATSNSVVVFTNCDATNYIGYAEVWYTKN